MKATKVQAAPSIKSVVPEPRWHGRSQSIWLHSLPSHNLYTQERSTEAQSSATTAMAECCFRPMGPPSHWWSCPSSCRRVHEISRNIIRPQYQCWCCSAPPRQDLLDTWLPRTTENRWWPSVQWNWFTWISNVHEMGRDQAHHSLTRRSRGQWPGRKLHENGKGLANHTDREEKLPAPTALSINATFVHGPPTRRVAVQQKSAHATAILSGAGTWPSGTTAPFTSKSSPEGIQGCQIQRQTTWHPARRSSPPPSKRL